VSFVPNADKASIAPAKLNYLLVKDPGKAKFFALFGFDPTRPQELESTLCWHVYNQQYDSSSMTVHGTKYAVKCSAPTPDTRNPCIISVWIIDAGHTTPRFVTAYARP
jgi:hypothetical protein